ncbi:MAG: DNA polymerase ligase N-terminal domain-containing protein [Planctomycetota bacterium]
MSARFVILHHTGFGNEHWDLMLEQGEILLTWRLEVDPTIRSNFPMGATRIGDHRKAYLDYEGPLSGGRGSVRRLDRGGLEWVATSPDRYEFHANGTVLKGLWVLETQSGNWVLRAGETS